MSRTRTEFRHHYPSWVARMAAVPPVFFAVVSVLDVGAAWPVIAGAVTVAILPWLMSAGGVELPTWQFAIWVIVPIAVINLAGDALGVDLSAQSHTQFTLMILVWLLGEMAAVARPTEVAGTAVTTVAVMAGRSVVEPSFGHSWMFWAGGAGIALITGYMLRRQQQTLSQLRQAQAALADEAVHRERRRIAREVHDVVAHTLTVTLMHLQAARRSLDHDPAATRETLEDAEALGRRSLSDIRRTVGLLRSEGEAPHSRALPDARDVPALLESYRSAGVVLRTSLDIDLEAVEPAAGLTLYRVLQESLSNAASHARGSAVEVSIRGDDTEVEIDVSNPTEDGPAHPPQGNGLGLVGMGERVRLLGGRFEAGPHGNGWRVHARFPMQTGAPAVTETTA